MLQLTTSCQNRHPRMFPDVLNTSGKPLDGLFDFFICGGRQRPSQDSETHQVENSLAEHPHGTSGHDRR